MADFHLVIPAFHEVQRLPLFLAEVTDALRAAPFTTDILIVEDGSPPAEQQQLAKRLKLGQQGACRVLEPIWCPQNEGKGAAIIRGWRAGRAARHFSFVDADGAIPAGEILRLFTRANTSGDGPAPAWWASRHLPGRTVQWNRGRYVLSRSFSLLAQAILGTRGHDLQCGFKIIPAAHYQQIAPWLGEARFCFDLELLLAVRQIGGQVVEVPIDWHDVAGGQLKPVRDGWAMVCRLPALRRKARGWAESARKERGV